MTDIRPSYTRLTSQKRAKNPCILSDRGLTYRHVVTLLTVDCIRYYIEEADSESLQDNAKPMKQWLISCTLTKTFEVKLTRQRKADGRIVDQLHPDEDVRG
ncbi:hypothetical protein AVEN_123304-1 [Araneus ventricosus]|uniref:Uncharacterized protein n=1 Tax=Araneus ventricosus TaxID=182803 RepID=A0A4Y2SG58_ARAVE|nr:hypothetical protein AVEN_123304-1 [Araneus ventricosus]